MGALIIFCIIFAGIFTVVAIMVFSETGEIIKEIQKEKSKKKKKDKLNEYAGDIAFNIFVILALLICGGLCIVPLTSEKEEIPEEDNRQVYIIKGTEVSILSPEEYDD